MSWGQTAQRVGCTVCPLLFISKTYHSHDKETIYKFRWLHTLRMHADLPCFRPHFL